MSSLNKIPKLTTDQQLLKANFELKLSKNSKDILIQRIERKDEEIRELKEELKIAKQRSTDNSNTAQIIKNKNNNLRNEVKRLSSENGLAAIKLSHLKKNIFLLDCKGKKVGN